ncbi:hypothetical protein RHMOL_Rhmol06G0130000 [Rhododendron molle]|uniref:Uncharacterized protein n=1 Tax=Rhododendron molle TaxID=49168 RepID=A0ACC0NBX6_RHOML|nr:hypothetical protein RHMOL_Rhmol06G0130000 [Rhododendron molle]
MLNLQERGDKKLARTPIDYAMNGRERDSDSLLKPITKILLGVAVITFMIVFVMKESPEWMQKLNLSGGRVPPWILACAVIVFTRLSKRTRDFLKRQGT